MELKFLAISDTHLGEDTSLLSFPRGRQHLWENLRAVFGNGDKFKIDEMILLGDIPDRTLSSTSQIITHTNAFIQTLGSAAQITRGGYIPGNHDHTLWTTYRERRYGEGQKYGISEPEGELIVEGGKPSNNGEKTFEELLSIFFGYPHGSAWRQILEDEQFDFAIANPLYAKKINGRTYVFTHGTHFRQDVTMPEWIKKVADYMEIDEALGKIEIKSDCDVDDANNLKELEMAVSPFVDSLWPSSHTNPTSRSDQFWYLLTTLSAKFQKKRPLIPEKSELFSWPDLKNTPDSRIKQLTPPGKPMHDSIERWQKYFLKHMLNFLKEKQLLTDATNELVFVYGDTHDGGWGELTKNYDGRDISIRIYNCGGWVVHNKEDHPACHLFAVDEDGNEYLLDVSFKDVRIEDKSIIELAARDSENRQRNTSRILRFLLKFWPVKEG
jgi:hypothetical protein